jgi:hypothetical protein
VAASAATIMEPQVWFVNITVFPFTNEKLSQAFLVALRVSTAQPPFSIDTSASTSHYTSMLGPPHKYVCVRRLFCEKYSI